MQHLSFALVEENIRITRLSGRSSAELGEVSDCRMSRVVHGLSTGNIPC